MARNDWKLLPDIIKKFQEESELSNEQIVRGTFIKLAGAISNDTPVDEGITRGNWYITTSQPSVAYNSNKKDKSKGESEFQAELSKTKDIMGKSLFLTNNSPNILVLENGGYLDANGSPANGPKTSGGYSKKAPNGMVVTNITRFARIIKEQADE